MFVSLHAIDYKLRNFIRSPAAEVGQIFSAEAFVVFVVVFTAVDSIHKLFRIAEDAVGEFLEELHIQAVVSYVILIVEEIEVHGLAEQCGFDGDSGIVGYNTVANRQHR